MRELMYWQAISEAIEEEMERDETVFVIGENAAGIHGANRLSQNALPELLVSGTQAGRAAALLSAEIIQAEIDPREAKTAIGSVNQMFARHTDIHPIALRNRLRQLMWEKVGLYRTKSSLLDSSYRMDVDKLSFCATSYRMNEFPPTCFHVPDE